MVESRVRVEAIHDIPYRFVTFMDIRDAKLMDLDGIYNVVVADPAPGTSVARVQRTLFATEGVASVQPVQAFAQSIRDLLAQVLGILRVIEGAVLLLALLIAFNSSAISVDERARENATMFAFGVPVRRVLANNVIESVVIGVIGTGIGIALGQVIVQYITHFLLPGTLPDVTIEPAVSAATMWTAIVLGIVAVAIAPLFTARRMRRMDIPATLRVVE
jgi:putative ABC transport system permease protein